MTGEIDLAKRLSGHIRALAGEIGERNVWRPQALRAAAEYLRAQWRAQGYRVSEQSYQVYGLHCVNLEAGGSHSLRAPTVLIGAHYDSVRGSPGANDNASGVATLLELSRLLRETSDTRNLRFVGFVNEEMPFFATALQGSELYARKAREQGTEIELMIALETMGCYSDEPGSQRYPPLLRFFYPNRANFLAMVSNFRCRSHLQRVVQAFRISSDFPVRQLVGPAAIPGLSWSDHNAFWRQGYPAIMVTDTAFYRYPYYHTALDTPERVCCTELAQVTLGLAGAIKRIADAASSPQTGKETGSIPVSSRSR